MIDSGLAPREGTPYGDLAVGTCYACDPPHPLIGDPLAHLAAIGLPKDTIIACFTEGPPSILRSWATSASPPPD